MLHPILHRKLSELVEARRSLRLRWANALVVALAATGLAVFFFLFRDAGIGYSRALLIALGWLAAGSLAARIWAGRVRFDPHQLARDIERHHPDMNALLLTAVEQEPGARGFSYLQERVIDDAVKIAARHMWADELTAADWRRASWARALAAIAFVAMCVWIAQDGLRERKRAVAAAKQPAAEKKAELKPEAKYEIAVTPGDAEVEKGSRLIVEAKFADSVPESAVIVVSDADGKERQRIPMRLTVDEQVFGGLIAKIDQDSRYRVEFAAEKSDEYKITTFVHPELVRSDVKITPPEYAKQPVKEIKNTLKVSALEGSEISFRFKINKPVAEAELFGEDKTIIPLKPSAADPAVLEAAMKPDHSQKYRLHLVDDKERSNKQPPWLTVNVLANQLPKIEITFPKRDAQVSAIQEMPVEANVSDDLGVRKAGAVFTIGGSSKEAPLSDKPLDAVKKHAVKAMLALENESAEPRQLVSYYLWAEDTGPAGEVRRAMSDMFFADVRHFEDIFREGEPPPSQPGQPQQRSPADKLVELQKQVVNATWRIIRDTNAGKKIENTTADVNVVRQSEQIALEQTKEAMEKAEDAEVKMALTEAWKAMKDAIGPLEQAAEEKKRSPLNQALVFEQSALEWLYKTASREHRVMRQNQRQQSGGQQQQNERQLMTLELKQQEQRYEEEKQAGEEQTAQQQENLQVLNRLKELARRQEALAEKIKELEKQIEKAKTEEEKQELASQLKRLQDEQEQLLRDLDDLNEKMENSENKAQMAEAKQQLDKTREQVMDAAEKLKEQQLAQAANAATRAQRELEQMQEDFRKKTSRKFADEMRQMKQQAAEAAAEQKKIAEALENTKSSDNPRDTGRSIDQMLDGAQTARNIEQQSERVDKLMEEMQRVSEQAEGSEPLLSQSLYDTVRKARTSALPENLQESRDYARIGERAMAQEAERKATKAVEDLQKGIDKAAESVLGSETEALRMARAELDSLIEEARKGEGGNARQEGEQQPKSESQASVASADSKPKDGDEQAGGSKAEPSRNPNEQAERKAQGEGEKQEGRQMAANEPKPGENRQSESNQPNQTGQQPGKDQQGQKQQQARSPQQGGQQPGEQPSQEGQPGQMAQNQNQEGKQPGQQGEGQGQQQNPQQAQASSQQGQQPGQQQGEGQPNQAQNGQRSQQRGQQPQAGEGGSSLAANDASSQQSQVQRPGENPSRDERGDDRRRGSRTSSGDDGGGWFFDAADQAEDRSPITGSDYDRWSDRLRNVEELLSQPELRNEAARVLDNTRSMRIEYKKSNQAPQAEHIAARIIDPLVELRSRVGEELAKREQGNQLAPVDRDPVPQAFRDLVRRYYQELGTGK